MFRKTQTIEARRVHTFVADTLSSWKARRDAAGKPPEPPEPTTLRDHVGCGHSPTMSEAFAR